MYEYMNYYTHAPKNIQNAGTITSKNWATGMINAIGRNILNDNERVKLMFQTKLNIIIVLMIDLIKND